MANKNTVRPPKGMGQSKVHTVMSEFGKGQLHSGNSGKVVTNRDQAIAIALSEAGLSKKKKTRFMGIKEQLRRHVKKSKTK